MDTETLKFLKVVGIDSVNPHALYVLIRTASGILLEDLAPLIVSLEVTYRRLLTLYLDTGVRDLLEERHSEKASLGGVTRSINSRYMKLLVPKEEEYITPHSVKTKPITRQVWLKPPVRFYESVYNELLPEETKFPTKPYAPHRIELARSKVSSPGFLEILGDPATLAQIIMLLGWLLSERRGERQLRDNKLIASRAFQHDNIASLKQIGYSREEIESISDYLGEDLSTILKVLRETGSQLAPGDRIDPGNSIEDASGNNVKDHRERD